MALNEWEATLTATVAGQLAAASSDCEQSGSLLAAILSSVYLKEEDFILQQLLQPSQESLLTDAVQEAVAVFAQVTPPEHAAAARAQCWQTLHSALIKHMKFRRSRHTVNTLARALLQHSAVPDQLSVVSERFRVGLDVYIEIANGSLLANCTLHHDCEAQVKGACISQIGKAVEDHPQLQKMLWDCGECGVLHVPQWLCISMRSSDAESSNVRKA